MFVLQTKRRSKIRRKARDCFSFASNSLQFAEKRVVVFQSKRPKNDRPKIRTKTRGRFSIVPSVVGLARVVARVARDSCVLVVFSVSFQLLEGYTTEKQP